jgi:hypothetical protein
MGRDFHGDGDAPQERRGAPAAMIFLCTCVRRRFCRRAAAPPQRAASVCRVRCARALVPPPAPSAGLSLARAPALSGSCCARWALWRRNETLNENLERGVSGLTRGSLRDVEALPVGSPVYLFNVNDKRLHGVFESVRAPRRGAAPAAAAAAPAAAALAAPPAAFPPKPKARSRRRCCACAQTSAGGLNLEPEAWISCSAAKIPGGGSPYPAQARAVRAHAPTAAATLPLGLGIERGAPRATAARSAHRAVARHAPADPRGARDHPARAPRVPARAAAPQALRVRHETHFCSAPAAPCLHHLITS